MLQWAQMPTHSWNCVELFSGAGRVSAQFRKLGKAVASFDKILGDNSMDMLQSAGFLFDAQCFSNVDG